MITDKNVQALVESAKGGGLPAFEELVVLNERMVYNISFRMMGDREDAVDISQETFIKAFRGLKKFDGKSAFSTWVYRIAVNCCLDELRKRKNKETVSLDREFAAEEASYKKQYISEEPLPEERVLGKEAGEELLEVLNLLAPEYKTAVVLRDIEGLSYYEIADATGAALGTVKSRIARGRKILKERFLSRGEQNKSFSRQIF